MGLFSKLKIKKDKNWEIKERQIAKQSKPDLTLAEIKSKADSASAAPAVKDLVSKKSRKENTKMAYRVLLKPLITEKGTHLAAKNKYLFLVAGSANKIEIKKAVSAVYNVSPVKVNIINLSGKEVRYGKTSGRTKDKKKAIVTLKPGQTISIYEGV